jgi:hypothetical protein
MPAKRASKSSTKSRKLRKPAASQRRAPKSAKSGRKSASRKNRNAPALEVLSLSGANRLSRALDTVSMSNKKAVGKLLRKKEFRPTDLAATFREVYAQGPAQATRLAEAYAKDLDDALYHRELFQEASEMKP